MRRGYEETTGLIEGIIVKLFSVTGIKKLLRKIGSIFKTGSTFKFRNALNLILPH